VRIRDCVPSGPCRGSWRSCPQSSSGRLGRRGRGRSPSCEARPSEVGGGRSSITAVPCLSINFHSSPSGSCEAAQSVARSPMHIAQIREVRRGPGTRNVEIGSCSKMEHRDPVQLEYPRKNKAAKAGSNNSNKERQLGHRVI
jgi:hypothetical protein